MSIMFWHSILSFLHLHSKLWFTIKIIRVQIKKQQNSSSVHRNNLDLASLRIHLCHSPFCRVVRHRHRVQSIHLPNKPMAERQLGETRPSLLLCTSWWPKNQACVINLLSDTTRIHPSLFTLSPLSVSSEKTDMSVELKRLTWLFLWNPVSCTWRIYLEMKPTEWKL